MLVCLSEFVLTDYGTRIHPTLLNINFPKGFHSNAIEEKMGFPITFKWSDFKITFFLNVKSILIQRALFHCK